MAKHVNVSVVALLLVAGCSQLIGISDYEIDPKLDAAAGEANAQGGDDGGKGGSKSDGGSKSGSGPKPDGGTDSLGGAPGDGGTPPTSHAGEPHSGGEPPVAGAGGTGGGTEIVDCDSEDCCTDLGGTPVGVELLGDGGFELGTPDEGSPWKEVSSPSEDNELLIGTDQFGFKARSGDWYAYLSGIAGEESTIYQTVTVPANAGWMVVSGYRLFQVDAQDDTNTDFCGIGFYELPSGDLLELPFFWTAPGDGSNGWGDTATWKRFEASWDAALHRGKKREIDFRGGSDDYPVTEVEEELDASAYLFDDLSLKAFHCEVPVQ